MFDRKLWNRQAEIVSGVLGKAPSFDKDYRLPPEEFQARQKKVWAMLQENGYDCGIVYSDEHYCGDVPYLAGNSNIMVEPVAAVLGANGLYFIAGLESGIVAEQLCHRSGVKIRKVDILKVDDPQYPAGLLTPMQIIEEACGKKPGKVALLTSRGIFPLGLYNTVKRYVGEAQIHDLSEKFYEIKYVKSDNEMKLIRESCLISDVMLEGMLRILRPGLCETQVAQWGYVIAHELGVEELGFKVMVTAGRNNRTIVGRPSNYVIQEGDAVHIGVSPKRDGLCGAQRISVQCVKAPEMVSGEYRLWMGFLEGAFGKAVDTMREIAEKDLPGCYHEEQMIAYYNAHRDELEKKSGLSLPNFAELKGYVTTHNSGYTECQEFYGALGTDFKRHLPSQLVMMIDAGLCGYRGSWDEAVIPGLDYLVIEKTAGKFGNRVEILNQLPVNLQHFVGEAF